jgi:hypothetical protein
MRKGHFVAAFAVALAFLVGPPAGAQRDLLPDIKAARATVGDTPTPEQTAALLNLIAWKNRDDGWGLSRKDGGTRCVSALVGSIACDILHHRPTNMLYDVFGAVGDVGGTRPQFDPVGPPQSADRVWVAPVDPGGIIITPPPPTNCELCEASRKELDAANVRLRDDLEIANRHAVRTQEELDTQRARALTAEAEVERLKNTQPPPVRCRAKAPSWLGIGCEIVR